MCITPKTFSKFKASAYRNSLAAPKQAVSPRHLNSSRLGAVGSSQPARTEILMQVIWLIIHSSNHQKPHLEVKRSTVPVKRAKFFGLAPCPSKISTTQAGQSSKSTTSGNTRWRIIRGRSIRPNIYPQDLKTPPLQDPGGNKYPCDCDQDIKSLRVHC